MAYAVVPSSRHDQFKDVVTSLPPHESPFPFGVRIVEVSTDGHGQTVKKDVLPMFFVSESAAKHRCHKTSPYNGAGVHPGWYVIPREGMQYVVELDIVNRYDHTLELDKENREEMVRCKLSVDGRKTGRNKIFSLSSHLTESFRTYQGFFEATSSSSSSVYPDNRREYDYKLFQFADLRTLGDPNDNENSDRKVGTVKMRFEAGQSTNAEFLKYTLLSGAGSESEAEEEDWNGSLLELKATSKVKIGTAESDVVKEVESSCYFDVMRRLHAAKITIYVREETWMRSRRIINEYGNPCTYDMFRMLVKADQDEALRQAEQKGQDMTIYPEKEVNGIVVIDMLKVNADIKPQRPIPVVKEKMDLCSLEM